MTSVRQFAEGLIQYVRGAVGTADSADDSAEAERLASERAALEAEREASRARRVEQQIVDFKRQGLLRATDTAEGLARAILQFGDTSVTQLGGQPTPLSLIFARFLEENGGVVPMGQIARTDPNRGAAASDRLISMARDTARQNNSGYLVAFAQVSSAHPDLARAAREEGF